MPAVNSTSTPAATTMVLLHVHCFATDLTRGAFVGGGQNNTCGFGSCWKHESPGNRNTKTAVLNLVGFVVGLHEVCASVRCGLREEVSSDDRSCGKALKKLRVVTLLDGGDMLLLGGALAES